MCRLERGQYVAKDLDLNERGHLRQRDDKTAGQRRRPEQLTQEQVKGTEPATAGRSPQRPDPQPPGAWHRHAGNDSCGAHGVGVLFLIVSVRAPMRTETVLEVDAEVL